MGIKEMLGKAFNLSTEWKFFVKIDDNEIKEMTYLELGLFLTSNVDKIEAIYIKTSGLDEN